MQGQRYVAIMIIEFLKMYDWFRNEETIETVIKPTIEVQGNFCFQHVLSADTSPEPILRFLIQNISAAIQSNELKEVTRFSLDHNRATNQILLNYHLLRDNKLRTLTFKTSCLSDQELKFYVDQDAARLHRASEAAKIPSVTLMLGDFDGVTD